MMPHLGVLASVHPRASLEVFERDCLIYLGTCVAPRGQAKPGRPCFRYTLQAGARQETGAIAVGELVRVPLGDGEKATVRVEPAPGFDCGAGEGRPVERAVVGGSVGIIFDGRGRPLHVSTDRAVSAPLVARWVQAVDMYPAAEREVPVGA